eukprot:6261437-Prymnesium_polylepis.2
MHAKADVCCLAVVIVDEDSRVVGGAREVGLRQPAVARFGHERPTERIGGVGESGCARLHHPKVVRAAVAAVREEKVEESITHAHRCGPALGLGRHADVGHVRRDGSLVPPVHEIHGRPHLPVGHEEAMELR